MATDAKDKKISEVPHLEELTGVEKIPVSATGGEPRYVEVKQIVEKANEGLNSLKDSVELVSDTVSDLNSDIRKFKPIDSIKTDYADPNFVDFLVGRKNAMGETSNEFEFLINKATTTTAGVMSATDKVNLDSNTEKLQGVENVADITDVENSLNTKANADDVNTNFESVDSSIKGINEHINTLDSNKADKSELSNIIGKDVVDEDTLEDFDKLTINDISKESFIPIWDYVCSGVNGQAAIGKYNKTTGFFELNGLTDITFDEAIRIYQTRISRVQDISYGCRYNTQRTNLNNAFIDYAHSASIAQAASSSKKLEVFRLTSNNGQGFSASDMQSAFHSCSSLRKIIPHIRVGSITNPNNAFYLCAALEDIQLHGVRCSYNFQWSPLLSYDSLSYMIKNATNTGAITITVHPDVFAKLTDSSNEEWYALNELAISKNITFATV